MLGIILNYLWPKTTPVVVEFNLFSVHTEWMEHNLTRILVSCREFKYLKGFSLDLTTTWTLTKEKKLKLKCGTTSKQYREVISRFNTNAIQKPARDFTSKVSRAIKAKQPSASFVEKA